MVLVAGKDSVEEGAQPDKEGESDEDQVPKRKRAKKPKAAARSARSKVYRKATAEELQTSLDAFEERKRLVLASCFV